jgi:L-amino acid N-acyltransferase YncA
MIPEELKTYQNQIILKDGTPVWLRAMNSNDCGTLLQLYSTASDEEVRYLRDNVRDPAVVRSWCEALDYERVYPLVAMLDQRVAGQATLHFGCGPERHLAKVRIFTAHDFRRHGLGMRMLNVLVGLARKCDLHLLVAEVVTDQTRVIRAFLGVGFDLCTTLKDYFMLPNGETRDVAILMLHLRPPDCDF